MIRYAKENELERVNELRKQVSDIHAKGKPEMCREDFGEEIQHEVYKTWENNDSDVIVAIKEGVICGFACVEYIDRPMSPYMMPKHFYHIKEFGVDERYRRQKIATELFAFIKNESAKKGYDRMELDVFAFNEGAVKFYESIGFLPYRIFMEYKQ